jgi:hypothetical protein
MVHHGCDDDDDDDDDDDGDDMLCYDAMMLRSYDAQL